MWNADRLRREQNSCVDVWKVPLCWTTAGFEHLAGLLSKEEAERASQIGSKPMRDTFIVARAALRCLLGRYLHCAPSTIGFSCQLHGKPRVSADTSLCFSASRSGNLALFAFSENTALGIDIERLRFVPHMERVVERMFSPDEKLQLHHLPRYEQERAFFACWTRKEAYAKAIGSGLLTPFENFSVDVTPDEPRPRIRFEDSPAAPQSWILHSLSGADGYAAAIAYHGTERTLSTFNVNSADELIAGGLVDSIGREFRG